MPFRSLDGRPGPHRRVSRLVRGAPPPAPRRDPRPRARGRRQRRAEARRPVAPRRTHARRRARPGGDRGRRGAARPRHGAGAARRAALRVAPRRRARAAPLRRVRAAAPRAAGPARGLGRGARVLRRRGRRGGGRGGARVAGAGGAGRAAALPRRLRRGPVRPRGGRRGRRGNPAADGRAPPPRRAAQVAEHVHARPTAPAELARAIGDAAALAATLRGARLAPARARLREVLARYDCTAATLAGGSLEAFVAARVEGGRFALAGRAGQRHRPLVVAREAFDGFPAPRDAAGAALVDGAVAELVAAADDCRVGDCARARRPPRRRGDRARRPDAAQVAFVERLLAGGGGGGGPRAALARRWVRDRGPPVDWRVLGAPPAERVRRHAKLACDGNDLSAAARVVPRPAGPGPSASVWGDEGFADAHSHPARPGSPDGHGDADGFPPTPYDALQRRVEEAAAERLEAERHARLPLHLLTRALASADALEAAGGVRRAALAAEFRRHGAARLADLTSGARAASPSRVARGARETRRAPGRRRRGPRDLPRRAPRPVRGRRGAERHAPGRPRAADVAARRRGPRRRAARAAPGAGARGDPAAVRGRRGPAGRVAGVAAVVRAQLRPVRRREALGRARARGAAARGPVRGAPARGRGGGRERLRGRGARADGRARRGRRRVAVEARPVPGGGRRAGAAGAAGAGGRLPGPGRRVDPEPVLGLPVPRLAQPEARPVPDGRRGRRPAAGAGAPGRRHGDGRGAGVRRAPARGARASAASRARAVDADATAARRRRPSARSTRTCGPRCSPAASTARRSARAAGGWWTRPGDGVSRRPWSAAAGRSASS